MHACYVILQCPCVYIVILLCCSLQAFSPNLKFLVSVGYHHDMMINVWNWKVCVLGGGDVFSDGITIFRFWLKTMDYSQAFWSISFRIHNSSLEGAMKLNLHQSDPLEMPFLMVSFFVEIKLFSFWPKTMDYSQAF